MKTTRRALLGLFLTSYACLACASSGIDGPAGRSLPAGEALFYPEEEPRLQFLLALSSWGDLRGTEPGGPGLGKPYGMAMEDSVLHVCDTMLRGVQLFDFGSRELEQWKPGGGAQMETPVSCRIDQETSELYVADPGRGQVLIFDSARNHVGDLELEDGRPIDAFVLGDTVWVADGATYQVHLFDKATRTWVRTLVDTAEVEGEDRLFQPTKLWVTEDEVYVTDFGDFKVKIYTRDGQFVRSVGSFGRGLGQFVRPKGIAVDRMRRLYVVDSGFDNVQIFNDEGALLLFFGGATGQLGGLNLPADIHLSYEEDDLALFRPYVATGYDLEYVLMVSSQFGQGQVNVYGFITPAKSAVADSR